MKPYDDKAGIEGYIVDLAGLNRLYRERHDAGYKRRERLAEFCVLGRFWFDTCGNCGVCIDRVPADLYRKNPYDDESHCPLVMTDAELKLFMRGEHFTAEFKTPFPPADARCAQCGEPWTLEDCHDLADNRDGTFEHVSCCRLGNARRQRVEMMDAFSKAGFPNANLVTIPNEYWKSEDYFVTPWYLVQVGEGQVFKIGWRKRVIKIDWSESKRDLTHLFEGENVTKAPNMIHAWGYEKAAEYLAKIVPELEPKRRHHAR